MAMAMAMSCMRALVISIIFLASIRLPMVTAAVLEEAPPGGYQFELIHVDAHGNFTREELIHRALNRARLRAAMLSGSGAQDKEDVDTNSAAVSGSFSVPVQYSPKTYMMELKLGSTVPETTMLAVADTGSDLIWTNQLKECIGNPSFTPTNMSCAEACSAVGKQCTTCMFNKTYGGGNITVFTGTETVAMTTGAGTTRKHEVALACAVDWTKKMLPVAAHGIVGLSRGAMSLVQQLGVTEFSYCLRDPLNSSMRSPLWFGGNAQSAAGGKKGWRTTPLVEISPERSRVPEWAKNDYYVELDQICINGKCSGQLQEEDFRLKSSDGGKGLMLVDSGNTYMHLDPKIFEALKRVMFDALGVKVVTKEITKGNGKGKSEMNCFDETPTGKPDLVLKFPKADMSIPWASYVEKGEHGFCLYILQGMSLLGNFQQHNVSMLYDLKENELSFKRVDDCSSITL